MKYFTPEYLNFFKELAANNNRDWFAANRRRYEQYVKEPLHKFIGDLIAELAKEDKRIQITPSEAIFRINRDIRFAKDKSPYKLYSSAAVNAGGKKDTQNAGLYMELGPEKLAFAGGMYQPEKDTLMMIRDAIAAKPAKFQAALADKSFKKYWGDVLGERNKVLPAEYKKVAEQVPHIYNKQFYYWTELDPQIIVSDKLMKTALDHYAASKSMRDFLEGALK